MKKMFLLVAAFCFTHWVMGQGSIVKAPDLNCGNGLICHLGAGQYATYSQTADGRNTFSLHSEGSPVVKSVIIPDEFAVNDMKMLGDTLYFCGYYDDGSRRRGMIGYLPLACFYEGGMFHADIAPPYTIMYDHSSSSGTPYLNHIIDITRMDLYRYGGDVNVVFTADNMQTLNGVKVYDHVGLGLLTYSTNGMDVRFLYNKDGVERFTDIAATENYVVAVSRTVDSSLLYIRVMPKNDYLTPTFVFLPSGLPWCYYANARCQGMNDQRVFSDVRVTALPGDCFMAGSLYDLGTEKGMSLKSFRINSNGAELVESANLPAVDSSAEWWKMHDMRYCVNTQRVMALADMADQNESTIRSRIFEIDVPFLSAPIPNEYMEYYYFRSLSDRPLGGFYAGGFLGGHSILHCWHEPTLGSTGCGVAGSMPLYNTNLKLYTILRPGNMNNPSFQPFEHPIEIEEYDDQNVCQ